MEAEKKVYFLLSPELADGCNTSTVEDKQAVLDAVKLWLDEFEGYAGETFCVETIEMTPAEFEALLDL